MEVSDVGTVDPQSSGSSAAGGTSATAGSSVNGSVGQVEEEEKVANATI